MDKNLSQYEFAQKIGYSRGSIGSMVRGNKAFPDHIKEQLLSIIEISEEEFESWVLADKYPKEIIKRAIELKKEHADEETLILTLKIDAFLNEKGLSRAQFAKQIGNSQSGLNRVIIGKEGLSKKLMLKLSLTLEVSVEEIQAWVLADKYTISLLELALNCSNK